MLGFPMIPRAKSPAPPSKLKASKLKTLSAALILAVACGISPSFAQSSPPITGRTASYDIELEAGTNLVALPVVPNADAVTDIVSGVLPQLTLVQSNAGRYFIPAQGIDELGSWNWAEAYKIVLASPATLTVEGPEILPQLSPILLESQVGNWVPYFRSEPIAVAEAFAPIAASLARVEAADGRFYQPGDETSTLDSLRTGRGYRIWVTQATTLTYPANPAQPTDGSAVSTLGGALALSGLTPGQEIEVLGYYAPGDGGGGTFLVTESGATPDGGIVFAPYTALSTEVTETTADLIGSATRTLTGKPAGADIVLGTLRLDLLQPGTSVVAFTANDWDLHGAAYQMDDPIHFDLDLDAGTVQDRKQRLMNYCLLLFGGTGWECDTRFSYRYTTSDLRLERQGVTDTYVADWWGIEADPAADFQPRLNWLIKSLEARNAASPGSITAIEFAKPAVYGYYGSIRWPDGVTLRGQGGTELVTVTNDLGLTYSPVRLKDVRTTLRVNDHEAIPHIRMSLDPSDPAFLAWDTKHVFKNRPTVIFIGNDVTEAGVEDIYLNGNWENNFTDAEGRELDDNTWYPFPKKEEWLRNNTGWSGFVTRTYSPAIPQGQQVTLSNVAVIGYGATGILGNPNSVWEGTNVRLGSTVWNHSLYEVRGSFTNLTVEGFAWNHIAWQGGETITNLVAEDLYPSNIRDDSFLFQNRGGDAYDQAEVLADAATNQNFRLNDGTVLDVFTEIYGCFIDLRGGPSLLNQAFNGLGKDVGISDCTIIGKPDQSPNLASAWVEKGNGYQKSMYPHYLLENVTLQGRGQELFGKMNTTESVFRGITMTDSLVTDGQGLNTTMTLWANYRDHPSFDNVAVNVFDGLTVEPVSNGIATVEVVPGTAGADYFVLNSSFNNSAGSVPFRNNTGNGYTANIGGAPSLLRVYMRDTEFRFNTQRFDNAEAFLDLAYFDNVTDPVSGLGSEAGGTVSFTATGGETFVDLDPNLWWVPMDATYVTTSGTDAGLVASVAPVCADPNAIDAFGNTTGSLDDRRDCDLRFTFTAPLSANQVVAFDWTAAIKPWPDSVAVPDTTLWLPESGPRSAP